MDYTYVSDVTRPGAHPGLRHDRHDARAEPGPLRDRQPAARARRPAPAVGSAEEIASLEIAQTYAFTLPQTIFAPAASDFIQRQSGPSRRSSAWRRGAFSTPTPASSTTRRAEQVTNTTLTAGANWGANYLNFSWFGTRPLTIAGQLVANSDQIRFAGGMDAGKYLRFDAAINYSADQNLVQEGRFLVTYKGSCYTVFVEYQGLDLPPSPRRSVRLVVNLKDIGTLLDVNGSINALFGP